MKKNKIKAIVSILLISCLAAAVILTAGCKITDKTGAKNDMVSAQKTAKGNKIKSSIPKENIQSVKNEMKAGYNRAKTDSESGKAEIINWPAASFPPGFPVYPEGELIYAESLVGDDFMVCVAETDKKTYDSYLDKLGAAGWMFSEPEDGIDMAYKGSYMLSLLYDDELGACIYIFDIGFDLEELYTDAEWPDNLPVKIPVYDGEVSFVSRNDDMTIITIDNTSKSALDAYEREAKNMGWNPDGDGFLSMEVETGVWLLFLDFDAKDNTAHIALTFMEN
ncbi:MAG: hypothetical protein FWD23_14945 [Oscillospiraceae bacterium]|nr:hypothetical protein [Oscillospiraceae bacterium]